MHMQKDGATVPQNGQVSTEIWNILQKNPDKLQCKFGFDLPETESKPPATDKTKAKKAAKPAATGGSDQITPEQFSLDQIPTILINQEYGKRRENVNIPVTPDTASAEEKAEREKDEFDGLTDEQVKELTDARIYKRADNGFPEPMATNAFDGVAGKIVSLVTEHSELCREAVLVQFLIAIGNMLGREPYLWQEATHHTNDFAAIVGKTSSGAKGGSIRAVKSLLRAIDPDYITGNCSGGFQSGEAVVEAIRDEVEIIKEDGDVEVLEGVPDKRLLVIEEEFSRLLKLSARQGSILSDIMRVAYDSDISLRARSKKHPAIASNPHISLIGHITPEELKVCMANADIYNGFANRILWCASKRSGKVPRLRFVNWCNHPEIMAHLRGMLIEFGPSRSESIEAGSQLEWSEAATEAWDEFYYGNESEAETTGGVVARGKAHVLRLSMIYALLARSAEIEPEHIESAQAVWEYCKASARWAFGDNSGNKFADRILSPLTRLTKLT
jgi:Protein of unknown function (DUF3987)